MTGGDITDITFNHPTLGSGSLFVKSDEDSELDQGGYRSSDDEKSIDSGGNMIDVMTRSRWSATAVIAGDPVADTLKTLTDLAGDPVLATWTITHISGVIYRGTGKPVGDIKEAMKPGTIQLKLAGGSKLNKIA